MDESNRPSSQTTWSGCVRSTTDKILAIIPPLSAFVAAVYGFVDLRGEKGVMGVKDESVHAAVTRRA